SGVRAVVVDATGTPRAEAYREVLPAYPAPGLVEHDPEALWRATLAVLGAVLARVPAERVRGLGIATQRGTALVWEAATGRAAAAGRSSGRCASRRRRCPRSSTRARCSAGWMCPGSRRSRSRRWSGTSRRR